MISEIVFYNKELCDGIREIVIKSPMSLETATRLLSGSNNYKRDVEIIIKLSCGGYPEKQIMIVISMMI